MRRDWEADQLRSELDDVDVHAPIVDPPLRHCPALHNGRVRLCTCGHGTGRLSGSVDGVL